MDFSFIFLDVREQLVRCYSRLRHIATAPEWAPEFALDSAKFYISLHLQKGETVTTEKKEIHQGELFAPHQEEKSSSAKRLKPCNPKRILVEGDPGMGKTTLCQNLAFRWGHEECTGECKCAPCVHSWTFVVYLNAANLKGFTDIHTAVHKHLLPKESSIEEVKAALKSSQSNTLFIIDSYDEGFKENVLLRDLIEGRVYANATLLLTSRPNYLEDLLKKAFDSKLSTDGFNREQKRLYVERFAKSKKENESKFEGLLDLINDKYNRGDITSLCSNPLHLAIICLLICEDGLPNITNRTELYKSVTKFLVKKASERMHRPMEEIEADIIRPICRLSFEAYKRNEVSLSKVDLEKVGVEADAVLQSGFLTKKVKVSLLDDPVERFFFSHKTFLEYLAVKHLAQTLGDLKDWLQTNTARQWQYEHKSLKSFFIDLLHGDSFVEASLVIMERFTFSRKTNEFHNFPASCLLLELLRHLQAKTIILSPEMEDEFKEKCLSIINCTIHDLYDNLTIITFATISQNAKPRDISMNLDTEAKHVVDYLRNLEECPTINLAIKCADESVANESSVADAMQRALQGSFFNYAANQLSSNIPLASYKEDSTDFLRIALEQGLGNDIQGMEYKTCAKDEGFGLESFMRAALEKPLKMLKMDLEEFDSDCLEMLLNLLKPQLKILHLSDVNGCYLKHLLPPLSRLDALDELYLHINYMSLMESQEIQYYEQILKMNKMQKLKIGRLNDDYDYYDYDYDDYYDGELSDELKSVLQRTIPTMTALKELQLYVKGSLDFWSSAEDHLQLESFTLRVAPLESDSFDNLCELIEKWTNLRSLHIHCIQNRVHLLKMFAAIAKCQMLNTLAIYDAEIGDDVIDPFLEMLKSFSQLESLKLWDNKLSADGKQKIKDLAQ
ncbi:hypothetical protein CAPTEDRAFT_207580 [Capitella teleta]|uniref:NACHT domain-containing protein n=1 Tax=Capitella teleta TaxID=283909 RepID=R7V8I2_CAPTE|nr:hypothetical protein CAPTEDRAFT_207580 [Capitella teleta]|eukprot:ELU14869.1 hypothetical protein CAPTEDRAFT_207580 [Capitella teleta]